jgi:hypothetical protein
LVTFRTVPRKSPSPGNSPSLPKPEPSIVFILSSLNIKPMPRKKNKKPIPKSQFDMGVWITFRKFMLLELPYTLNSVYMPFLVWRVNYFMSCKGYTIAVMMDGTTRMLPYNIGVIAGWLPGNHFDRCSNFTIFNVHYFQSHIKGVISNLMLGNDVLRVVSEKEKRRVVDKMKRFKVNKGEVARRIR